MQPPVAGPRVSPGAPPWQPRADVAAAAWPMLPLPLLPRMMDEAALPHMAALADFRAALQQAVDEPGMETSQRLARLDALELALSGAFGPAMNRPELRAAVVLRESLLKTGGSFQDMMALADACRDEVEAEHRNGGLELDEDAWLGHAARAAAPVLRYLMLLHGERDEALLAKADDLARLWYLLPAATTSWRPRLEELARNSRGLWRQVQSPALRGQLFRLQALALAALLRIDGAPLAVPAGHSPAQALARHLPLLARAGAYWRARRLARSG